MPTSKAFFLIQKDKKVADSTIKEMIDFFETMIENFSPKEKEKKSSAAAKKSKKNSKKRKHKDSDSSVVEFSEESTVERRPSKKYCILHGKCSTSKDDCKVLHAMVNKHRN